MVNSDVGQAILEAISRLSANIDARLAKVEARLDSVEAKLDVHDKRFDAIDKRFDAIDKRFDAIDERFGSVETRLSDIEKQMNRFQRRLETLEAVVAELTTEIKSWPDMHYLSVSARRQMEDSRELRDDVRNIKIRIDEIFRNMATDPEIQALRGEVTTVRQQSYDFELRLRTIEARLGMGAQHPPLA